MIKKSVLIFVILSIAASALNYTIYPLFSRILAPAEYINITVSLSLLTQISAFLSSIIAITIGLSKTDHAENVGGQLQLLQAFLFKLFIVIAVLFLIASPLIMSGVHTPALYALPISLMMLFSIPILVISGYLNGKNKMVKLGLVAVVSASSQFMIGLSAASLSRSGLITMLSMTIAQVVTLVIIYFIFSQDQLPGITKPLTIPLRALKGRRMRALITYTASASVALMAISLVQIADLFILQSLQHTDVKFYTDIYVISRVVFFAGMIFIWPFLGEISVDHHHFNRRPFSKVVSLFTAIALAAVIILYFFGDTVATFLFGTSYGLRLVGSVGVLSVLYKYFLLIVTAVVLYFVVLRNYMAIWFSLAVSGAIFVFSELISKHSDMITVLLGLNLIAGSAAVIGIVLLLHTPVRKSS